MSKIVGDYNIATSIAREGERLNLDGMATGGNVDYVSKYIGKNEDGSERIGIISNAGDAGSPEKLSDPADLVIILSETWEDSVKVPFPTAKEALAALAKAKSTGA